MTAQHSASHGHEDPDSGSHEEKKPWYYNPIWIVALLLALFIGGWVISHYTSDSSPKAAPVTTAPSTEPVVVPRGPTGGNTTAPAPNVIAVPDQPAAGSTQVEVIAPKDYNVKIEVTER